MDGRRQPDTLSESDLDREIESLLAVEPAADFVARARRHATEVSSARRWQWPLAAAMTAAAVIIGVALWPSADRVPSPVNAPPQSAGARSIPRETASTETNPVAPDLRRRPVPQPARQHAFDDFPAVVIADNEVRAYSALLTSVRAPRTELSMPLPPNPDNPVEVDAMPAIVPVSVDPIEIKPLVQ